MSQQSAIIASILLIKARTVQSEETRCNCSAHQRFLSVATSHSICIPHSRRANRDWQIHFKTMRNTGGIDDWCSRPISLKVHAVPAL